MINKKKITICSFINILFPLILTYQSNADIIWKFETKKYLQNKFLKKDRFERNYDENNETLRLKPKSDKNFKITNISIDKVYEHNIIQGPKNSKTNKLIISSLRGNTSVSGEGETFNIVITYNNKPYTIEIGNIELSGYLNGNFIGMPEAPFDNLKLETSIKVNKKLMSLGKKWQTSQDNLKSYISFKLNSILQKISYKNDLKLDWITHDEDISLTQKQYELGVELKDNFKITDNLSLHTKAYRNFPLLEKSNTGLSSLSSGFNIGITYDLNPFPFKQENEKSDFSEKNHKFIQIYRQSNIATPQGVSDVSENDYDGELVFKNILPFEGQEIGISASLGNISKKGWVLSYKEGKKYSNFALEEIEKIFSPTNDYLTSAYGSMKIKSLEIDRIFMRKKHNNFKNYFFTGLKLGHANLDYTTESTFKERTRIKNKSNDFYIGGITLGIGLRKFFGSNNYVFTEQSLSHY
ncbi:hypothetical protein N9U67_00725, partial [bacterium]|nr:hypothetical protein [bacterium]